jgi:predicted phage terminase large subunit-like protein
VSVLTDPLALAAGYLEGENTREFPTPGTLAQYIEPRTIQTPALDLLDTALIAAAEKRQPRLIFTMPPQEGKSQRVSRTFPFWLLKRNPDLRIAVVSYADHLARGWGRAVRNDIQDNPDVGLAIRHDTSAANEWRISGYDGGMITVGIGGGLTGRPVDVLIIDDPFEGQSEADSRTYRERAKEWWRTTGSMRLSEDAIVIVLMTRWHQDDLAGYLLAEDRDGWNYINIPALADHDPAKGETDPLGREPGEWLKSARGRTVRGWEKRRKDAGSRGFAAVMQGRPTPADGGIFKRDWWQTYDNPRVVETGGGRWELLGLDMAVWSWDCTFKDTDGSDYVVGQLWGKKGTDAFLLEQKRGRWDFTETARQIELASVRYPGIPLLIEDKANGPAVINHLRQRVPGIIPITPQDSKQARASAVAPFVEAGNVHLPASHLAPWIGDWLEELTTFPNSSHDDQVDAATQGLHRLFLGQHAGASFLDELVQMRR